METVGLKIKNDTRFFLWSLLASIHSVEDHVDIVSNYSPLNKE